MVLQDLDFIFESLDVECHGYVEWIELKEFDECLFYKSLDIEQLESAIKTVCGPKSNGRCKKEYFPYIVKELERRHFMEEKIKWDFRALDLDDVGRISMKSALFLFKAVHGDKFSQRYWNTFVDNRLDPESDVCFDEIKIHLCNIPEFASSNGDQEFLEQEKIIKDQSMKKLQGYHKNLMDMQEDESTIAATEQERRDNSAAIKNKADNLLNRMDEIGMEALLEDDLDGSQYGGRPKEKVTASEILEALKEKYSVLRERILTEMLKRQVGDGMWQAMSEHEQHENLVQLKLKEEKLRREGKLDTMAIHLPGARSAVEYNVFGMMGESIAELEKRIADEEEKVKESGLSSEEVTKEFSKKLDNKEKENSSTEQLLLDLNSRYSKELELISKRLQGLSKDKLLSPSEREGCLFALIQARLRGVQESQFISASVSVGLSERIQPVRHDRSANDPGRHLLLSGARIEQHKSRRSYDGPVVPPKLFPLKSKLGRVDLALQLLQDSERRYSLEREFLLSSMNSKEFYMYRSSARKLNEDERQRQLFVLLAQWQGFRSKRRDEKRSLLTQNRKCLEEACALKLESVKVEMEASGSSSDGVSRSVRDADVYVELLARLQKRQDSQCQKMLDVGSRDKDELEVSWKEQVNAIIEEWFENVAVVLFGIVETSPEEEELLKALNDKYDSLRDKLLLDALMNQHGKSEWDRMSEQERQNQLARLRMLEKKLRREGKYDELAKLLGDLSANSDLLGKMLGENRQKYLDQLNERLRNRQRRIDNGEDPDDFDDAELIDERPDSSTGNILKDLDKRFEDERDALLRRLREEQDRERRERERQAELARLRLEARKAEREANFDGAALVLGLAERNKAALEDRLKSDRERQEQLARERLAARRNKKKSRNEEDPVDPIEPGKDDLTGWQDSVLKELERKHSKERNLLLDLLQEKESEDLKQEAREMSADQRNERLVKLKTKRNELDLSVKSEQEEHVPILEMALSIKYINKHEHLVAEKSSEDPPPSLDDVIISLTADLQQLQDEETRRILEVLPEKSQPELVSLREEQIEDQKYQRVENVAKLAFAMDNETSDKDIVKALDKKYDTLMDKLLLEALKKQMGDAEWAKMNEQERQRLIMRKRLEQKKLLKEGKFDEAARLLGEGFKTDANLKNLMGENRKKYQELLEERLRERKERIARGEPVDDLALEELPEEYIDDTPVDAKSLLEDLQKRYDDEKDELLARLQSSSSKFMDERERQAELARLRREQRRAQQEEKFGAAALVFGLAERNQNAAQERLKNDRARQEQLAKERLERLRNKRTSKDETSNNMEASIKDGDDIQEVLIKHVDDRQTQEQMQLIELYQSKNKELIEQFEMISFDQRQQQLQALLGEAMNEEKYEKCLKEMVCLKHCNRYKALVSFNRNDRCSDDNLLVTILADLQQVQDQESEELMKASLEAGKDQILEMQAREAKLCESKQFPNVPAVLAIPESIKSVDENVLVEALETKYDTLKDKLILDALEKQAGAANWAQMNERGRQQELLKIKLQEKKLKQEGKMDEAARLMNNLLQRDTNLKSLLGATKEEQVKRLQERLEKRKQRQAAGMSEDQIEELESQEDKQFEEDVTKETTGNALEDLQKNFDAEKDALLSMLSNADTKLNNERKRQLELARLRREARKAQAEEKYDAAALVLGMAKSQQAAVDAKMKGARTRQEQLARERIQALKNKRMAAQQQQQQEEGKEDEKAPEEESIESLQDTDDTIQLQENVLSITEKKHKGERDLLMKLIQDNDEQSEQRNKAKQLSPQDKAAKLFGLKELRKQWREGESADPEEQLQVFNEAIATKFEQLCEEDSTKSEEEHSVKLLADLQDHQDREAEHLMKDLSEKDITTLKQLIQIQHRALQQQIHDNVAAVLLGIKLHGAQSSDKNELENELVEALKEKYDALKDKIYEEALKAKFGEEAWNAMSDKEKQELLINMRANDEFNNNDEADLDSVILPGMEKLIGKTRAKQDKRMKERMEQRRRAKAEGKTEEEISREEQEEDTRTENDVQTGGDVIKDLQSQFQAEKDVILGMLKNADSKELNERERQLALAKLRRDKLKIKREQKYDGAALVLNLAKDNQAKKDASLENERGRQEQLARERIAALKKRREQQQQERDNGDDQQTEAEKVHAEKERDAKDDLSAIEQMQREGTVALHDAVLDEMEKKHTSEQDALMDMVQAVESEKATMEEASKLSDGERKENLNLKSIQRKKLKEQSKQLFSSQPPENAMTEEEKGNFDVSVAADREAQSKLMKGALALKLVDTKNQLKSGSNVEESNVNEEASVMLMADLQEKQTQESNALLQAMQQSDNETVEKLKDEQRKARRGGWMDNIASVVFGDPPKKKKISDPKVEAEIEKEFKKEEANLQKEADEEMAQFQKEMEQEKEQKLSSMSEDEINNFMKELKAREEEKRKAVQDQIEKQRERAKQRMAEKRKKRDEKEFESDLASAMIVNAQKRSEMMREKTMAVQGAQKDSLEERLRRRREERKKRQDEETEQLRQEEEAEKQRQFEEENKKREREENEKAEAAAKKTAAEETRKPDATEIAATAANAAAPQVKKKKLPPLPGGGMKREKTVVEKAAEISDDKKKEMITMMMREQTTMAMKINKEQHRQEELVRELREKRRKKVEARNEEVAKVLGLGARQKTIVEDKKKSERDRQIDQIRERVNRIKQGRTIGTKEPKEDEGESFANMAEQNDHDKMERLAQEMEKQFKDGGEVASTPGKSAEQSEEKNPTTATTEDEQAAKTGRGKLDEKTRASILKEKLRDRKLRRGSQIPPETDKEKDAEDTV